jgi:glutamate---cysteine ligase / carboxylate-amine ligase
VCPPVREQGGSDAQEGHAVKAQRAPRTFGVEEEMLLVDRRTHLPCRGAHAVLAEHLAERGSAAGADASQPRLAFEVKEEQIEVVSPPALDVAGLEGLIREGRGIADQAAARVGATIAALGTSPYEGHAHLVPNERYLRLAENFGLTAEEQLTCGFHVHVAVADLDEAVAVLDRIRRWLPIVLALSANSPFWQGRPTGFASYRDQAWGRWPTTGPSSLFGSADAYRRRVRSLLVSGVPLDEGMLYFDARYSARVPTVEVRVADVCQDAHHAATIAGVVRALVETASRDAEAGVPPDDVSVDLLRVWKFQASRGGVSGQLVDPASRRAVPAADAVEGLLEYIRPVLLDYGEERFMAEGLARILAEGSGAAAQLDAFGRRALLTDVVVDAVRRTNSQPGSPSAPEG